LITLSARVIAPRDVVFREIDGEAVILNLSTGKYFGLDAVGTFMWQCIARANNLQEAHGTLLDKFEVASEVLEHDLINLVRELSLHGLLLVAEPE